MLQVKYSNLGALHCFTPVAIETSGVFGPKSLLFVRELGRRLARVTSLSNLPLSLLYMYLVCHLSTLSH